MKWVGVVNLSNISVSVLVIVIIWLTVLASIVVSKYRNRENVPYQHTERRRTDRRRSTKTSSVLNGEEDELQHRRKYDRRTEKDWKADFRKIRAQIEDELDPKDF